MNSNSKSKGRLNSDSSNGKRKKQKSNQKTLGMAWGHNSRSSSFRTSPFSNFGSYMAVKNEKLHQQFDAEASTSSHTANPIFQGLSIFVDGYTTPSTQELRSYMLKHGGRFENYFSRHHVTHIICSNLPDSKIKNLRSFSRGLPIVKPTWIVDSVAAGRLLNWVTYQLAGDAPSQPKLSSFFTVTSNTVSDIGATCTTKTGISDVLKSPIQGEEHECAHLPEGFGASEHVKLFASDYGISEHVNFSGSVDGEPTSSGGGQCKVEEAERNLIATEFGNITESLQHTVTRKESSSVQSDFIDDQNLGPPSSKAVEPSSHHHSMLSDPNFVENYFKSSRLHFIGTWRTRYRKRFFTLSDGFTSKSPGCGTASQKTTVIHVDMDCFFVSVVIRNHPELWNKPVAVCHSDNPRGTAEISSANYPARDYGVKAGMFVRDAKARCPHLIILPYNFEAYEEVADQFYNILHKHCKKVQAVSCDEAFLDVTESPVDDFQLLASIIRKEIVDATGCTASVGISGNMLIARLATRVAKPDGHCYIPIEKVNEFLHELPVKVLPGIGHVLEEKLKSRQITTCGQLRAISKESLQKDFGLKTGDMLWNYSRGIDNRLVGMMQETKSVGAEVNWGVRFNDLKDAQTFLVKLSKEVALRLQGCGAQGRSFALKIKKRKADAQEPTKYLGCGDCENMSHSLTVPEATDNPDVLQRITTQLFASFSMDVKDIRGMGLQVSKLKEADNAKQGAERSSIRSWLLDSSAKTRGQPSISLSDETANTGRPSNRRESAFYNGESSAGTGASHPPMHELDVGVLECLPSEVLSEINDMYGGKLLSFISQSKKKSGCSSDSNKKNCSVIGMTNDKDKPYSFYAPPESEIEEAFNRDIHVGDLVNDKAEEGKEKGDLSARKEIKLGPFSDEGMSKMSPCAVNGITSFMPSSLSQVDTTVLQELPEDLRTDILDLLPAHRIPDAEVDVPLHVENKTLSGYSTPGDNLWVGSPPRWIDKFKASSCVISNMFVELYFKAGSDGQLSRMLQLALSDSCFALKEISDAWDYDASSFCELLVQYANGKMETDIEEIYVCARILKRLSSRSKFFSQIYDMFVPHLQASVGEIYGGNLLITSA